MSAMNVKLHQYLSAPQPLHRNATKKYRANPDGSPESLTLIGEVLIQIYLRLVEVNPKSISVRSLFERKRWKNTFHEDLKTN